MIAFVISSIVVMLSMAGYILYQAVMLDNYRKMLKDSVKLPF